MVSVRATGDGGRVHTARCKKLLLPLFVFACWLYFGPPGWANSTCRLKIDLDTGVYPAGEPEISEPGSPPSRDISAPTLRTIAWLKANSPTANRVITTLENAPAEYKIMGYPDADIIAQAKDLRIEFSGVADYFWSDRNQIHWDPRTGLKWTTFGQFKVEQFPGDMRLGFHTQTRKGSKGFISPAIALIHELGHAYDKEINHARFAAEAETYIGGRWGTLEERRVVTEIEWPVVKELRENAGTTDALRPSHNGVGTYGFQPYEFLGTETSHY